MVYCNPNCAMEQNGPSSVGTGHDSENLVVKLTAFLLLAILAGTTSSLFAAEPDTTPVTAEPEAGSAAAVSEIKPAATETESKPAAAESDTKPAAAESDTKPAATEAE